MIRARSRLWIAALLCGALAACVPPIVPDATPAVASPPAPAAPSMLEALPATVVAVREEVQLATPGAPKVAVDDIVDTGFADCAVRLITRWEVGSESAYTRKWQGVIWPGGISGPTWGIGYDGGHQTRLDIVRDWEAHDARTRLADTSGVTGQSAKVRLPEWRDIRTPFPYAADVFIHASLPSYTAAARRALGPGFVSLPSGTRCALVSLGYNRGWQTSGDRRREIRAIRDECVAGPEPRSACVAQQLRAMKRLWPDVRGLRDRREDEARTAERHAAAEPPIQVLLIPTIPPPSRATPPRWSQTGGLIGAAP